MLSQLWLFILRSFTLLTMLMEQPLSGNVGFRQRETRHGIPQTSFLVEGVPTVAEWVKDLSWLCSTLGSIPSLTQGLGPGVVTAVAQIQSLVSWSRNSHKLWVWQKKKHK